MCWGPGEGFSRKTWDRFIVETTLKKNITNYFAISSSFSTCFFNCLGESSGNDVMAVLLISYVQILCGRKHAVIMACMVITYSPGKDQPGMFANPARGQLDREN